MVMGAIYGKLASLGIEAVAQIGDRLTQGLQPTEWNHALNSGLVYHIPSSEIRFIKLVLVKEYESGVFLRDGKLYAVLPPGRWFLGRMPVVGRMEFIWVDTTMQKIRFGLRTMTSDGVELGANGVVHLRVSDAERFIINLVAAQSMYQAVDLGRFLRDQINSIMRAEMANYDVKSLYLEREMFISVARVKLQEMFGDLGLEFQTIEIPGIMLPEEVTEAMREPLIANQEAQATVSRGSATAQVLGKIREAGVDPVQFKAAEALMKYAERPPGEGTPLGGDFLMPMVFYGMLMKESGIPGDVKNQLKNMFPQYEQGGQQPTSPPPSGGGGVSRDQVLKVLEGLEMRLALGEISEATYKELKSKWETKLEG